MWYKSNFRDVLHNLSKYERIMTDDPEEEGYFSIDAVTASFDHEKREFYNSFFRIYQSKNKHERDLEFIRITKLL